MTTDNFERHRAISRHSTKTPLRFCFAVAMWLAATAAAFAQTRGPTIALALNPAEVAEMLRLIDLQPVGRRPPAAFLDLQLTIDKALRANPDAQRAVLSLRGAVR
jgi:hypothetical protein